MSASLKDWIASISEKLAQCVDRTEIDWIGLPGHQSLLVFEARISGL